MKSFLVNLVLTVNTLVEVEAEDELGAMLTAVTSPSAKENARAALVDAAKGQNWMMVSEVKAVHARAEVAEQELVNRYGVSSSAGVRNGNRFAVLDRFDKQDGKGMRRVSFHNTLKAAMAQARRLNAAEKGES